MNHAENRSLRRLLLTHELAFLVLVAVAGAVGGASAYFWRLRFRDRAAAAGIDVPLIPGVLPVTNFAKVVEFSEKCATDVPDWMAQLFHGLDADPETRKMIALSTAVDQCRALEAEGVDDFHFYTLNRADLSYAICWRLGLRPKGLSAGRAAEATI